MDTTKIVNVLKFGNEILPLAGGSVGVEIDPTVPQYVKDITEENIASWDAKIDKVKSVSGYSVAYVEDSDGTRGLVIDNGNTAHANYLIRRGENSNIYLPNAPESDTDSTNKLYVDTKVASVVGAAPEMLDTIEEVAKAIEENADVVDALNSAIGLKADKSSVPKITTTQLEDGSYSLSITTGV